MSVAELSARAPEHTTPLPALPQDSLAVLLVAVVAIAPVPLGSNRPLFWAVWAVAIGLLAAVYGLGLLLKAPAHASIVRYWPELTGTLLLMGWLGVQLLPLGGWLPTLTLVPKLGLAAPSISLDPGSTRLALLSFATYGLLFVLCAQVATDRRLAHRMVLGIFLVITAFAAYSLVNLVQLGDTLLGFEKLYYRGAATGPFVNRNSFATFLAAGLALGVALLTSRLGRIRRAGSTGSYAQAALVLVSLLCIAAALLATGSRMGLIAGGVGACVALLLVLPARHPSVWLGFAAALTLIVILVAMFGIETLERLIFVSDETGRATLYGQVWDAILERPWTGYGGGSFAAVFPMFQHPPLANDGIWDKAHSTYLALWFEMGFIFGSIPVLIVLGLLFRAVAGLWNSSTRSLSVAAIAVVVVFALHSLVDFSAEIMADAFLFTAILALGSASGLPSERPAR